MRWAYMVTGGVLAAGALVFLSVVADQLTVVHSRLEHRRKTEQREREQEANAPPVTVAPASTAGPFGDTDSGASNPKPGDRGAA